MSFVTDQIRRIDNQLDRIQLGTGTGTSIASSPELHVDTQSTEDQEHDEQPLGTGLNLKRINELQNTIRALSTSSSSPILTSTSLLSLLVNANLSDYGPFASNQESLEAELEWILVGKSTVQTYGIILNSFLGQIIPLSNDIWYWDDVMGSYFYGGIYTLQTSPIRIWKYSKAIYEDTIDRMNSLRRKKINVLSQEGSDEASLPLSARWKQFYGLVRQSVQERSFLDFQSNILTPVTRARMEARHKQKRLRKLREMSASGLGVLIDEGLNFDINDVDSDLSKQAESNDEWKNIVAKSVLLMETVLQNATTLDTSLHDFEDAVFAHVENDPESINSQDSSPSHPALLSKKLQQILTTHIPDHQARSRKLARTYGRPSRLVRYWPALAMLFLSSSTLLRIFFRRKAEIRRWVADFGATVQDFWFNWVVEPLRKVVGTIRHDSGSEIAIMSKESLRGDRESLERMVVEFAIDNPESGSNLTEHEIADLRAKVKEGDLTPVLKAYEKDLRKPFMGTIRGNLVRALLIQIQKTKVDVEVAIGGIDALLKSQELVFGFVGLTPGILVCLSAGRWMASTFGGRKGRSKSASKTRMTRVLRNVDRILESSSSDRRMLSYKERGLLLCEVHILRQNAKAVFPSEISREFLEDIGDLVDVRSGIERQVRVVERIRWTYWKWLQ